MSYKLDREELCEICETLDFENDGEIEFPGALHLKPTCLLCTWILESHQRYATVFPGFRKDGTDRIVVTVIPRRNFLGLKLTTSPEWFGPKFQYNLFLDLDTGEESARTIKSRQLHSDPASEPCFAMISAWLQECLESHPTCNAASDILPTRVIDLSIPQRPFLYQPVQGMQAPYIALSHCWGTSQPLTTVTANLEAHKQQIPYNSLPRTFQDAIKITARLGFKYLWIDSLCVLQDCQDDWAGESARMGQYYNNAVLTLSALYSASAIGGMLKHRPPTRASKISPRNIYVRDQNYSGWTDIFASAPLNSRGWALQERLLSRRVLHYSKEELFWECMTCSRREGAAGFFTDAEKHCHLNKRMEVHTSRFGRRMDFTNFHHNLEPDQTLDYGRDFKRYLFDPNLQSMPHEEVFRRWHRIVDEYTARFLTKETDKLPAISGIVSVFLSVSNFTYIAGLWKEDPLALLWRPDYRVGSARYHKKSTCQVPSWSWISIEGRVTWEPVEEFSQPIEGVLSARITSSKVLPLLSLNPMGEVQPGSTIGIRTHIKTVKYRPLSASGVLTCAIYDEYLERIGTGYLDVQVPDPEQENLTSRTSPVSASSTSSRSSSAFLPSSTSLDQAAPRSPRTEIEPRSRSYTVCHAVRITERQATIYTPREMWPAWPRCTNMRITWFLLVASANSAEGHWVRIGIGSTEIKGCTVPGYFDRTTPTEINLW